MIVDSHCHLDSLDLTKYAGKLEKAIEFAKENDVGHMLSAGVTIKEFPDVLRIAETFSNVSCSVALHPSEIVETEPSAETLVELANHPKVVAIGETGLDYYYNDVNQELQRDRFRHHIQAANYINKPLIVHTRNASGDTLQIMKEEKAMNVSGVMHCFTEDWDVAKKALDLGFYISFSGIVTFKKAESIRDVVKKVPLDRLLIETDAPYLAPVPFRGKPNEPAYVKYVAIFLADLLHVPYQKFADQTTANFFRLFQKATC